MERNKRRRWLWLGLALGFVVATSGCGKGWSVKGASFPPSARSDRTPSAPQEEEPKIIGVVPSQREIKEEGEDDLSRRAKELKEEADRLAGELALLSQEGREIPAVPEGGDGEKGEGSGPHQLGRSAGKDAATPPLSDVFFAFDSFLLSEEAQRVLQKNAEWLRSNPEAQIVIEGHCDERGTVEYNLALGERRAQSVKDYLVNLGISADRLFTISYGKERPFVLGHTEEAWAQNRRAHFLLR
jgi:peptidoglycan-associated lipoprotein